MEKNRVEAFSDGVIAIAITLLVLDIHVPPFRAGQDLGAALAGQWPGYAAYVVSFVTIGIVWINHHATLRRLSCVDHTLLLLNLLLLLVIGVVPWSTSLFAEYLTEPDGGRLAGVIYGGTMLVMTIVFYTMQHHILFGSHRLTREEIDEADARRVGRRARLGLLPYAVATAGALVSAYLLPHARHLRADRRLLRPARHGLRASGSPRVAARTPSPGRGA